MTLFARLRANPLQKINYLEMCFAFFAHVITFPILGILTGLICGYAVHYAIGIQQDGKKPGTRQRAFYGVVVFKIAQTWMHQTSFAFILRLFGRTELPFGYSIDFWAWFATGLIFTVDIWALSTSAKEAAERAEAAEVEESFARVREREEREAAERAEREAAERQARADRDAADRAERLELARIKAEADKAAKLAAEETARKIAEAEVEKERTRAELERKRVETEWNIAELERKRVEDEKKAAELERKRVEDERKAAEAEKKRAEAERKAEEAKNRLEREAAEKAAIDKELAEIEARRAKWRSQKAKRSGHNGHHDENKPETAQMEAIEA